MKYRFICLFCILCLMAGCASRNTESAQAAPPPSSSEESSVPVAQSIAPPEPAPASSEAPQEEEAPEYPAPLLTDTEKELLAGNLSLFVHFIGGQELSSPAALSKETLLAACLADIERTSDMNAYFFEQDDSKNDLIPAELVSDKANQLFGVEGFDATDDEAYNSDKECYVGQAVEIAPAEASDIMGAPDDLVVYSVTTGQGEYLYYGKILRQNGMPYLRFISSEKAPQ